MKRPIKFSDYEKINNEYAERFSAGGEVLDRSKPPSMFAKGFGAGLVQVV